MNPNQDLFSFAGRISRRIFWRIWLTMFAISLAIAVVQSMIGREGFILSLVWLPFSCWVGLAMQVKRWHDRDKSGWMVLINLLPIIGWIWALLELGFRLGTTGPNRYGNDPLLPATNDPMTTNSPETQSNPAPSPTGTKDSEIAGFCGLLLGAAGIVCGVVSLVKISGYNSKIVEVEARAVKVEALLQRIDSLSVEVEKSSRTSQQLRQETQHAFNQVAGALQDIREGMSKLEPKSAPRR